MLDNRALLRRGFTTDAEQWKTTDITAETGKISAQSHTIVKQICFANRNVLFSLLFSLSKN